MVLVTSTLAGIIGIIFRFELPAEAAGFKVHAIGVTLMVASVVGLGAWLLPRAMAAAVAAARTARQVLSRQHEQAGVGIDVAVFTARDRLGV